MRTKEDISQLQMLTKFGNKRYSREERYFIILSRDLLHGVRVINSLGIEKAKEHQAFYDFILSFEELTAKMKEFSWSPGFLKENGINFKEIRKLYFAVA